jgi:hypothetical protein
MGRISFDQIQQVAIEASSSCIKTFPCKHKCEITLTDGRKKSVTLFNTSIGSLIEKISQEKINYQGQLEHFSSKRPTSPDNPPKHWIEAQEILNELFDETATSEAPAEKQSLPLVQIQTENEVKSNVNRFFNKRNMLIIAGVIATLGIVLLGSNYSQQPTEASREAANLQRSIVTNQELSPSEAAKQAANLQRSCTVTNREKSLVGTGEEIAKCILDLFDNTDDIKINCNPQLMQGTIAKGEKTDTLCDGVVKNNFNGHVIASVDHGGVRLKRNNLSKYLKEALEIGAKDFTITLDQDKVNKWSDNLNSIFESIKNGLR